MPDATWDKLRGVFPYSILVFWPRREFTIGEWIKIFETCGMHLNVRVERNRR